MNEVITIGLDIAKNVFQVHGVDCAGDVVIRRRLRRRQVLPFFKKLPGCLVGIEACTTAHHWGRQLVGLGHEVKLMPPHYVTQSGHSFDYTFQRVGTENQAPNQPPLPTTTLAVRSRP